MNTKRSSSNSLKAFTNVEIKHGHTWGCPVFVLEVRAQSGHFPKWDPEARVGIYLDHSPCHAGSVLLVLHLKTIHVSYQFYVFYDTFSKVPYMLNGEVPPHWDELVIHSTESATDQNIYIANTWATEEMSHEGYQINLDPNLIPAKSFKKTLELTPKSINFDKTPNIPIVIDQNNKQQDTDYLLCQGDICLSVLQ